jgi:methylenetetrahydrofolate reductase (NADPH)
MRPEQSELQKRIETGGTLLLAELHPPCGSDASPVRQAARQYAGRVHALVVSDNRDRVCMSAMAAASVVASQGIEPILTVLTRDRNRIALVSEFLGAQALGIRNLLCTTGRHQTLGRARAAKNVFDIDSTQLIQTYSRLSADGSVVGETSIDGLGPVCLGAVASPYADPMELQLLRLAKKASAGAQFLITQPVFDLGRFEAWWSEVAGRELHRKMAIVAGVQLLGDAASARALAQSRPSPCVPESLLGRVAAKPDRAGQCAAAIEIAVETVQRLLQLDGLRGIQIRTDGDTDAALETLDRSGLQPD